LSQREGIFTKHYMGHCISGAESARRSWVNLSTLPEAGAAGAVRVGEPRIGGVEAAPHCDDGSVLQQLAALHLQVQLQQQ